MSKNILSNNKKPYNYLAPVDDKDFVNCSECGKLYHLMYYRIHLKKKHGITHDPLTGKRVPMEDLQ